MQLECRPAVLPPIMYILARHSRRGTYIAKQEIRESGHRIGTDNPEPVLNSPSGGASSIAICVVVSWAMPAFSCSALFTVLTLSSHCSKIRDRWEFQPWLSMIFLFRARLMTPTFPVVHYVIQCYSYHMSLEATMRQQHGLWDQLYARIQTQIPQNIHRIIMATTSVRVRIDFNISLKVQLVHLWPFYNGHDKNWPNYTQTLSIWCMVVHLCGIQCPWSKSERRSGPFWLFLPCGTTYMLFARIRVKDYVSFSAW